MICAKCGSPAVVRRGRFGAFWCCPNSRPGDNHGTRTVTTEHLPDGASPFPAPDLELLVRTKMVAQFGVHMSDLDLFVEGAPEDTDWDEDHWSNVRPY